MEAVAVAKGAGPAVTYEPHVLADAAQISSFAEEQKQRIAVGRVVEIANHCDGFNSLPFSELINLSRARRLRFASGVDTAGDLKLLPRRMSAVVRWTRPVAT